MEEDVVQLVEEELVLLILGIVAVVTKPPCDFPFDPLALLKCSALFAIALLPVLAPRPKRQIT